MSSDRLTSLFRSSPLWVSDRELSSLLDSDTQVPGLDMAWYVRAYRNSSEALQSFEDCQNDYLSNVKREARSPNQIFDEAWYRSTYPDVTELIRSGRVASAWSHYANEGVYALKSPAFWFDERWYRRQYCEVGAAIAVGGLASGIEHFLLHGIHQDLSPSIYFNSGWYRREYLREYQGQWRIPVVHYLRSKPSLRPCPTPLFEPEWYRRQYLGGSGESENRAALTPFEHYIYFGRGLGFSPSSHFDEGAYRRAYPEAGAKIANGEYRSGLEHYIGEGMLNGYIAFSHMNHGGVDYAAPAFMQSYLKSINLNLKLVAQMKEMAGKA